MNQPVQGLMKTTMESIKNIIDVNTVVGDAVETKDGTIIVPVSRVSFAFVAGGGDLTPNNTTPTAEEDSNHPFAGGSGAGVSVQPIGFLVTTNGQLRMMPVNYNTAVDRMIDLVPTFIENINSMRNKKNNDN